MSLVLSGFIEYSRVDTKGGIYPWYVPVQVFYLHLPALFGTSLQYVLKILRKRMVAHILWEVAHLLWMFLVVHFPFQGCPRLRYNSDHSYLSNHNSTQVLIKSLLLMSKTRSPINQTSSQENSKLTAFISNSAKLTGSFAILNIKYDIIVNSSS